MGFFAEVGPLTVFVSHQVGGSFGHVHRQVHCIVPHSSSTRICASTPTQIRRPSHQKTRCVMFLRPVSRMPHGRPVSQIIEKNTKVRLKIVGTRVDATEIASPSSRCLVPSYDVLTAPLVRDRNYQGGPSRRYRLKSCSVWFTCFAPTGRFVC